jgi:hypothetical protein
MSVATFRAQLSLPCVLLIAVDGIGATLRHICTLVRTVEDVAGVLRPVRGHVPPPMLANRWNRRAPLVIG